MNIYCEKIFCEYSINIDFNVNFFELFKEKCAKITVHFFVLFTCIEFFFHVKNINLFNKSRVAHCTFCFFSIIDHALNTETHFL